MFSTLSFISSIFSFNLSIFSGIVSVFSAIDSFNSVFFSLITFIVLSIFLVTKSRPFLAELLISSLVFLPDFGANSKPRSQLFLNSLLNISLTLDKKYIKNLY